MSVLEIMKKAEWVSFRRCEDKKLFYVCACGLDSDVGYDEFFEFSIPFDDTLGASFPDIDDKPMLYMRWIRKQHEHNEALASEIERLKKEWSDEHGQPGGISG